MAIKDMPYQEAALQLMNHMRRFTVLRGVLTSTPMDALNNMLAQLYAGEAYAAAGEYHALSHALLTGGYRRVSGDLFQDYLLHMLLEEENEFSRLAANNLWDEPLAAAMRLDLKLIEPFFELNSATVKRWLGDCHQDSKRPARPQQYPKDNIAVLSSAVWSGGTTRPLPAANSQNNPQPAGRSLPPLDENSFVSWRYQPPEQEGDYVADLALEEIYRRLLETTDRGLLLDDLWNFHATYGTGAFLKNRLFVLDIAGSLLPVSRMMEEEAFSFHQAERAQAMMSVIRFMQGERTENMLFTGGPGTGKTTQVFTLARELPELRLICCPPGCMDTLSFFLEKLLEQPHKFLLFLDDFQPDDPAWPRLKAALAPAGVQPPQVMVVAATRHADDTFFPIKIQLPQPQIKEFIELVQLLLLQRGRDIDFDSIQNACIDYAAQAGKNGTPPLSYRAANVVAELLINE
ncbi:DUF815 domain-containing protein [Christensenellaceae bacterium OttesenSCG-928-L17]|nr:DUF815 domain-containing protein [Christensenellaceae bacterium OttesenSCG-928-L17]